MSFTPVEKSRILYYLGYSGFEDDGPAMRAINSLDAKEATMGPIVRDLLDKLQQVDNELMTTLPLSKATSVGGGVQTRAHYTFEHMMRVGRTYVNRLANWTKVMVYSDVFSTSGRARTTQHYSGDPSEHRVDADRGVPTVDGGSDLGH